MLAGRRPEWLTFDCYGTLIQWDEGLLTAVREILRRHDAIEVEPKTLIGLYDRHEHALEASRPHRSFREVAGEGLRLALLDIGIEGSADDIDVLTSAISRMPPFAEVVAARGVLKAAGFRLCIISNTDDAIISGNVAQLGGHINCVVTAEQAQAYKPSRQIFHHAHGLLGVGPDDIVHICASPHLDHAGARDVGFRCVWIDRGTGRKLLPDYTPDVTLPTLDRVPDLFRAIGWM